MSKVIIFPTDTVYGIGCPIFDIKGQERIYKIKKRSYDKPLACLCADISQILEIAFVSPSAKMLIEAFMPGGLTLILPAKPNVITQIGYKTIGVRIPNHTLAVSILKKNGPMLTTSVNESGKEALNDFLIIQKIYNGLVDEIYPPNQVSSSIASTIVDYTREKPKLLREGEVTLQKINEVLNA